MCLYNLLHTLIFSCCHFFTPPHQHAFLLFSTTYRPETTLNYGLERAWCIAATKDANKIAIGYDEGTVVLKLGNEKPVASLDTNSGESLLGGIN